MHDREPETGDATSCAVLSILHWRCCRYPACVACGKFTELSILRWRCRRGCTSAARRVAQVAFQYSVGDAHPERARAVFMTSRHTFQYSVGDAEPNQAKQILRRVARLSILRWRCGDDGIRWGIPVCWNPFNTPLEMLCLRRHGLLPSVWHDFQYSVGDANVRDNSGKTPLHYAAFNTPLEMHAVAMQYISGVKPAQLSILRWRCWRGNCRVKNVDKRTCFQYSVGDALRCAARLRSSTGQETFNTPLEMHLASDYGWIWLWRTFNTPLEMPGWSETMAQSCVSSRFQYSVGDAVVARSRDVHAEVHLSILRWRCWKW
jgi:hypothetical protein